MRKPLIAFAILLLACLIILVIVFLVVSRDIPPPDTADLTPEHIELPSEQNASTCFIEAKKALYWPKSSTKIGGYLTGKPTDAAAIEELITRNTATFEAVRRGLACQRCVMPVTPGFGNDHIVAWGNIGKLLAIKVRHDRLAGQYAEASGNCIALLHFGNTIQQDAEGLVPYLVGLVVLEGGLTQARDLACDPRMPSAEKAPLSEALHTLGPFDHGLVEATKAEYRDMAVEIDKVRDGTSDFGSESMSALMKTPLARFLVQPNKTKLMVAKIAREVINDAPRTYSNTNRSGSGAGRGEDQSILKHFLQPNMVGKNVARLMRSSGEIIVDKKYLMECSVAATSLQLACIAYRGAEGRLPEDLSALVPKYLPSIPADPYDGKPFRYAPAKGVVYSVGKDLKDSGGSTILPPGWNSATAAKKRSLAEDVVYEIDAP